MIHFRFFQNQITRPIATRIKVATNAVCSLIRHVCLSGVSAPLSHWCAKADTLSTPDTTRVVYRAPVGFVLRTRRSVRGTAYEWRAACQGSAARLATCLALSTLLLGSLRAEDFYIAQDAAGADSGASCENAKALAWLNTSGNWGSGAGKVSAGDTVHLCGQFTNTLTAQGSGSAGSPVTIIFETGANFTWGLWPAVGGAINVSGKAYITIDGNNTGFIRNTNNGNALGNETDSVGIYSSAPNTNFIVKNLTITNLFEKTDIADTGSGGNGILTWGQFITISNCNISRMDTPIVLPLSLDYQTNILLFANRLTECNWCVALGAGVAGTYITNFTMASNYFERGTNWVVGSTFHGNGLHAFNNDYDLSGVIEGVYIFNNRFGSNFGGSTTAAIFWDLSRYANRTRHFFLFNNLSEEGAFSWGNGDWVAGGSNAWCFNNTSWATSASVSGRRFGGESAYFYNNLMKNGSLSLEGGLNIVDGLDGYHWQTNTGGTSYFTTNELQTVTNFFRNTWSDYNVWGPIPSFGMTVVNAYAVGGFGTPYLDRWQTYYTGWSAAHADPNSTTNYPTFDSGTYVPSSGDTVARGKGTNLTAALQAVAGFRSEMLTDYYGNARPGGTTQWTIGAFESGNTDTAPAASGIRIGGFILRR